MSDEAAFADAGMVVIDILEDLEMQRLYSWKVRAVSVMPKSDNGREGAESGCGRDVRLILTKVL